MKPWHFIYSRRWLVILGLFVVLVSLGFVYLTQFANTNQPASPQTADSEQNIEETPIPSTAIVDDTTTWVAGESATNHPVDSPEAKAVAVVNQIGLALQDEDSQTLYDLLSSQIKDVFTVESVRTAMGETVGLKLQPTGDVKIDGEWAEQEVTGTDSEGNTEKYKIILHQEDGQWKLYGTTGVE